MTIGAREEKAGSNSQKYLKKLALREYELVRNAIAEYDSHLFRIRSWNIAITALFLGGYLGLSSAGIVASNSQQLAAIKLEPGLAIFSLLLISSAFWFLDAFNKSLQTVHIYNANDLERYIRGEAKDYLGYTISVRFRKKNKHHFRPSLKNMTDESVAIFYLGTGAMGVVIISAASAIRGGCQPFGSKFCGLTPDDFLLLPLAFLALFVILLSLAWKSRKHPKLRYLFFREKYAQWQFSKFLEQSLTEKLKAYQNRYRIVSGVRIGYCFANIVIQDKQAKGLISRDNSEDSRNIAIFIDRSNKPRSPRYIHSRRKMVQSLGYRHVSVPIALVVRPRFSLSRVLRKRDIYDDDRPSNIRGQKIFLRNDNVQQLVDWLLSCIDVDVGEVLRATIVR